ncbi:hypothetical protein ACPWT1_03100 [Ramlibacter sp. MMS24-I3-19]|uniref:hypothetical protein n=1 Tax=Ramlibacter sp. MMS24-I3-19 TaxID=3416606 RepID=UPI003D004EA2
MHRIQSIDTQLSQMFRGFDEIAHSLQLQGMGTLRKISRDDLPIAGIYFIEVWAGRKSTLQDWLTEFQAAFDREEFKQWFVPSCQKGRIRRHEVLQEWMPLYLGKAKKIGKRLWEHLYLEKQHRTFALKLQARELLAPYRYRLSVLPLEVRNYDVIAPRLEAALRRKHLPLVGRQ